MVIIIIIENNLYQLVLPWCTVDSYINDDYYLVVHNIIALIEDNRFMVTVIITLMKITAICLQ